MQLIPRNFTNKKEFSVKSSATNFSLVINQPVNCESQNVIYCISCNKSPANMFNIFIC